MQTASTSTSSRSPIRMNSNRRHTSIATDDEDRISRQTNDDDVDDDEFYEPPVKRTSASARKTTTTTEKTQQSVSTSVSTGSVKRTSTGVPVSSRIASNTSTVVSHGI